MNLDFETGIGSVSTTTYSENTRLLSSTYVHTVFPVLWYPEDMGQKCLATETQQASYHTPFYDAFEAASI